MTTAEGMSAEQLDGAVKALRYTLGVLDEASRQAAGGSPEDAASADMTVAEAIALAPFLAHLLIATRAELGKLLGVSGTDEVTAFVRTHLTAQIEVCEMNAAFADVEAEVKGAAKSAGD